MSDQELKRTVKAMELLQQKHKALPKQRESFKRAGI
jgi:hypothetical protein